MLDAATRAWACNQIEEYARRREEYVDLSRVVRQVLEHIAAVLAPHAIVQIRAKEVPSFAGKILRKRATYPNPIADLTDLCGGRVIVHTREEVERVCTFLEKNLSIDWDNSDDTGARLKSSEFGYLSRHYVIDMGQSILPTGAIPVEMPSRLSPMVNPRVEIQVRTLLQHAWADVSHDLLYKAGFDVPYAWQREFARLAATLEASDESIARLQEGLKTYATSYGTYLNEEQLENEADLLRFVYEQDPDSIELALQAALVARARGDWDAVCEVLGPHESSGQAVVLRELGAAMCKANSTRPKGKDYRRGQRLIEASTKGNEAEWGAGLAQLADTWSGVDEDMAAESYRQAFELCPEDPHVLEQHLSYEIPGTGGISVASAAKPAIKQALEVCRSRKAVGVDLPWAHFSAGYFLLLLGDPYEAIGEYSKGVQLSTSPFMLEKALSTIQRIGNSTADVRGVEWVRMLLLLGLAVRYPDPKRLAVMKSMASRAASLNPPVAILAGCCTNERSEYVSSISGLVMQGFQDYRGTVIGGGTVDGVSGLVGVLGEADGCVATIGYVPRYIPIHTSADARYTELRTTPGTDFSPLGPLQSWIDILASGIDARSVRVLGIGGGRISGVEYRIALGLGATVATLSDSGRAAALLHQDDDWSAETRLLRLPMDSESLRAYIGSQSESLGDADLREAIARAVHAEYLRTQVHEPRSQEPSLAEWEELAESLRESNRYQADDMYAKLARIGLQAVRVDGKPTPYTFTQEQVELLAEAEHGRWVVERLLSGWRLGETKDVVNKVSPYLVEWALLSEEVRDYDRHAVAAIPRVLEQQGLELRETAF